MKTLWRLKRNPLWISAMAMMMGGSWADAAPPIAPTPPVMPRVAPRAPVRAPAAAPRAAAPRASAIQRPAVNSTIRNPVAATANSNAAATTTSTAAQLRARATNLGQAKGLTSATTNATAINDFARPGFGGEFTNQAALNQNLNTGVSTLQQQLNLSSGQISQINSFQNNFNQEMISLNNRFASDPQGTTALATQARQQLQQQINSVLTPQQRLNLSQLSGQPDPFSGDNAFANANTSTTANNLLNYGALNMLTGNSGLLPASAMSPINSGNATSNSPVTGLLGANQRTSMMNVTQAGANAATNAGLKSNAQLVNATGFTTITNPNVQKALNLTNQQISQLQQYQLDYAQQLGSLSSQFQTNPQDATTLYNNAVSQSQQRINSVLTPTQRQILSNITGVPDTFSGDSSLPKTLPTTPSE